MNKQRMYNSQLKANKIIRLENCTIVDKGLERTGNLWIQDGRIIDGQQVFYCRKIHADITIDCKGLIVCPGFIDLQINGGYGVDFSDATKNLDLGVSKVAKELIKTGVTAFCPTLITSSSDTYKKILPEVSVRESSESEGAAILGLHLEGPFINKDRRGAHNEKLVRQFNDNAVESIRTVYGEQMNQTRIVTLAPELAKSDEAIKHLKTVWNINVSLGHSAANLEQAERAVKCGANMITHLFNAMLPYHHRDPHLVGLLTSDKVNKPIYFGIIADEIHTHPSALRLAWSALPSGLMLVTDAMAALGLGSGKYQLGSLAVTVVDNPNRCALLTNKDETPSETLAGSIVTLPECIWNLSKNARCSIATAINAATNVPANAIGLKQLGNLNNGSRADIVVLDYSKTEGVKVKCAFAGGQFAFIENDYNVSVREK